MTVATLMQNTLEAAELAGDAEGRPDLGAGRRLAGGRLSGFDERRLRRSDRGLRRSGKVAWI